MCCILRICLDLLMHQYTEHLPIKRNNNIMEFASGIRMPNMHYQRESCNYIHSNCYIHSNTIFFILGGGSTIIIFTSWNLLWCLDHDIAHIIIVIKLYDWPVAHVLQCMRCTQVYSRVMARYIILCYVPTIHCLEFHSNWILIGISWCSYYQSLFSIPW